MSDIYGHLFGMPFARYDPTTQSWRTSLDTSLLDLPMSSLTLPRSGGMRSGQLFERPMLEPATDAHDCSSLPTPHAGLGERGRDGVILNPKGQQDLQHAIAHLLPTPTVQAAKHLLDDRGVGTLDDSNLWSVAGRLTPLLPTPRAQNGEERNMNIYARPLDQPQNLENALALLPKLTGDSTPKPSDDGQTLLGDQHQHQLSLDPQVDHD
jgi:hypothetical protein